MHVIKCSSSGIKSGCLSRGAKYNSKIKSKKMHFVTIDLWLNLRVTQKMLYVVLFMSKNYNMTQKSTASI